MTLKEKFAQFTKQESWEKMNYNAKECELIADDYAIEFALFLSSNCKTNGDKDGWWFYKNEWKTTNEVLEIFKKEKGL